MPVATAEKKGLMSAKDKKYGINYFYIQGTTLIKLCMSNIAWARSGGYILVSAGSYVDMYIFSMQKTNDDYTIKVKSLSSKTTPSKFYFKGNDLYFYYNTNIGSWANIFGISNTSFVNLGVNEEIDESYTEITPE